MADITEQLCGLERCPGCGKSYTQFRYYNNFDRAALESALLGDGAISQVKVRLAKGAAAQVHGREKRLAWADHIGACSPGTVDCLCEGEALQDARRAARDRLADGLPGKGRTLAESFLWDALAGGRSLESARGLEIARASGVSVRSLRRAIKTLGVKCQRVGGIAGAGSWIWTLPE